jgi:hypothetical protein
MRRLRKASYGKTAMTLTVQDSNSLVSALLTTGLGQECQKQSLHAARPERSSPLGTKVEIEHAGRAKGLGVNRAVRD